MSSSPSIDGSRKSSSGNSPRDVAETPTQVSTEHATKQEVVVQILSFQLLRRFQSIARKVVVMCRVCMHLRVASKAFMQVWATLTKYGSKTQTEEEQRESSKAAFDLQYFKSQHNNLSIREIQITMKVPEQRSMEELELLLVVLRSLLSFRHYSKSYQLLLAKIMRYERFRRRRVITRKGDPAHSFYFIYSGGVSFTTDQDGSSAFKEEQQADLRKGARFGEIPVLKCLRRNFTAVCVEDTELLVVDKEDFFANKLDQVLVEEAHHRFIFFRSLNLLQSLPDSSIEVLSDHSTTEEFLYGQVIPHNMDNLIFVTKGRFVILRLVDLSRCHSYHRFIAQELPFIKNIYKGTESIATFKVDKRLLNLTSRRASLYQHQKHSSGLSKKREHLRSLSETFKQHRSSTNKRDGEASILSGSFAMLEPTPSGSRQNVTVEQWKLQKMGSATSEHSEDIPLPSSKPTKQPSAGHHSQLPKALAVAAYMRIDSILPGEVFGLRQYFKPNNLKDKRTFSIKSVGTKIVRIDMETFAEIADNKTLQKVRKLQSVYPSDDELCELFIRSNFWKTFKKEMIAKITSGSRRLSTVGKAPLSGQGEAVYEIDKTGLLNLPEIASNPHSIFSKPPYYVTPVIRVKEDEDFKLPEIDLQLIHGVEKIPSNLKHVLF
ncbi:cyclic nucleotide-binding domain-containing protein 2-like [Pristis pectinata]|uniref:cyclic nucleotide-binding domain-containing protein 2-like n=1 Tax=Pristis pectinata TaxID=685728 RepID=UPI00223D42B2|nr:cyclic nucleotide-binding domain-containing protein 2-like [Pristis pectinata]